MFMVFNKDKILSYLVSLGTVALLFVMSFAITKKNDEILKTSANAVKANEISANANVIQNSIDSSNSISNVVASNIISNETMSNTTIKK